MPDDTDLIDAAQRLLGERISKVKDAADARALTQAARDQLTAAERAERRAYHTALTAGWTAAELKKIGLTPPTHKGPGRPRQT